MYSIYYVYVLLSLSINNIWITTPLTIKLLEEIMREYHYNFGIKLLAEQNSSFINCSIYIFTWWEKVYKKFELKNLIIKEWFYMEFYEKQAL